MSKTVITLTDFSTDQDLDTYATNPAKKLNDYLPIKWLNDALTFSDAWNELELIDWGYWFSLPTWKRKDAAHLFFGIEPISVKSEDIQEDFTIKIKRFTTTAEAKQKNNLTPREWLEWGELQGFQSIGGLKNALIHFVPIKETVLIEQPIKSQEKINKRVFTKEEITSRRQKALDEISFRGCKQLILELWNDIEKLHGNKVNGTLVHRILKRNYSDEKFELKTVQNHLTNLRRDNLIP